MQPRLKTSKKWTAIPKELSVQIKQVFKQSFATQIGGGTIFADGRIYPSEILMSVGFKPAGGGLRQFNWDISIEYKRDKDNVMKLLTMAVDVAGSLFAQLFESENDHDFPRIWTEVDFEGKKVFVQYQTENSELESEANKLLGVAEGEELVGGEWEDDLSADDIKAQLGIDPEDEELSALADDLLKEVADDEPAPKPAPTATKKPIGGGKKKPTTH